MKHTPTQPARPDVEGSVDEGSRRVTVSTTRWAVLLSLPHIAGTVDAVTSTSKAASKPAAIPVFEAEKLSSTMGLEHVNTKVVPTRCQPARHCKNVI